MSILSVASFRGSYFYVRDIEDRGIGREYQVHEFPYQTQPYIEDLGSQTQYFRFVGFVSTDDNTYVSRDLLEAALMLEGTGELLHPTRGMFQAACVRQTIGERMNEKGLVQVDLEFVAATTKPEVPFTPLGAIDTQGDLLGYALSGLGDLSCSIGSAAADALTGVVGIGTSIAVSSAMSGIDSIFTNSTCGRYSQEPSEATVTILNNYTGKSDAQKYASAGQITISTLSQGTSEMESCISIAEESVRQGIVSS